MKLNLRGFEKALKKLANEYGLELFGEDGIFLLRNTFADALNAVFIVKGAERPLLPYHLFAGSGAVIPEAWEEYANKKATQVSPSGHIVYKNGVPCTLAPS